ncbi:Asp23/Gls24 family envelope stress response protein [Helcococcus sueciensis]|uniref:Asp23/Gls24 family envelope stress response protein n=1 Tax=Helcococcus sueciensis TaxID=241555 RepID=UPI000414A8A7|nr:Asp23/Gls24 family envelope stress response protein [Helcococcus sueciensis]
MTDFNNGSVRISNDIIDQLIAESALQVEGVEDVIGYKNKKIEKNKKEGIVAVVKDNTIKVGLTVILKSGAELQKVAENVQKSISEQIETMLGIKVLEVNVFVKDLA